MSKSATPQRDPRLDLLTNALGNKPSLTGAFEKLYKSKKGDWPSIERSLRRNKSFSTAMIGRLAFTHELATWTGDNKPLVALFQSKKETGSMRDIALNLNKTALNKLVKGAALPKGVAKNEYVDQLYTNLYAQEPTAVVVNLIQDPKIDFWNNEAGNMIASVLQKQPEFNIRSTSVYELLNKSAILKQVPKDQIESFTQNLKTLQRITLISPVPEAIPALINANYTSAYSITQLPTKQYLATMLGSELPYETLEYIYAEAEKKKAFYEHALITIKEAGEPTGIAMIDSGTTQNTDNVPAVNPGVAQTLAKRYLSWDLLFGDVDFCECGECTSVYSAAAYYVDLLQYLRNNNLEPSDKTYPKGIADTPLQKLFNRRPDLEHLELTCKNTNTILPYVDLVNEVMEQYVAYKKTTAFNVTNETSGELLSAPQHTEQRKAYQTLAEARYPFNLPYHQPIDATRIFLNHLNTSRYELIDTFRSNNADINFNTAADAEFLGLTEEEFTIITKESFGGAPDNRDTEEYYGLMDVGSWLSNLSNIGGEFLPRTGITFEELEELLKTEYINPGFSKPHQVKMLKSFTQKFSEALAIYKRKAGGDDDGVFSANPDLKRLMDGYGAAEQTEKLNQFFTSISPCIVLNRPNPDCSLAGITLLHYDNNTLTAEDYGRIHRLIRLWRKLGFTIEETDRVIMSVGEGSISPELIHQLVAVKKIMTQTGIELTKLLCFWGDIGITGDQSLFKRLFLSHNLTAMDPVFESELTGNQLLQNHLPVVMAALNLSADDIQVIKEFESLQADVPMTITHLSLLYRYRLLSKALGLRIRPFIKFLEVFGNAFEDADTTLQFLENLKKVEEAGFDVNQLSYLITGVDSVSKPLAPSSIDVLVVAKKIHDGINEIDFEHADLDSDLLATTELVRSKASILYDPEVVEKIIQLVSVDNTFSTKVSKDLDFTIPSGISYVLNYQKETGLLQITGEPSNSEIAELKLLKDNQPTPKLLGAQWIQGIDHIVDQQNTVRNGKQVNKDIFNVVLSGLLTGVVSPTPAEVERYLVGDDVLKTSSSKKCYTFLQVFLPHFREQLKDNLIVTTLSELTGLDKRVVHCLATDILKIGGNSLNKVLASLKDLFPGTSSTTSWNGKLIPLADADYIFEVRAESNKEFTVGLDGLVIINHTADQVQPVTTIESTSAEIKLLAGKVYQFSADGINMSNIRWKTKTSTFEHIHVKAMLPEFYEKQTKLALELVKRMTLLINTLSLSSDELSYFHTHRADFDHIDFNSLSHLHLLRVIDYCNLRNSLPKATINMLQFWARLNNPEIGLSDHIAQLTKWKKQHIDQLIASQHFNLSKADFKNEKALLKLQKSLSVADKIGMDIDQLFQWAIPTFDFNKSRSIADNIQKTIRAKYSQTDWEAVVKPLNDQLRNNQKNALIAYLLQHPDLKAAGVADADGLFEYFLIDVQMDTCMETSRIKQAISSVQLFIQRCFLGLEEESSSIKPGDLSRGRWEWMQRYRVWEANRKVFLYPENWIESNLRDDKSAFFKELESELLQKDINKQNVTDALKAYLYKVDEVANMEVIGLYVDGNKGGTVWEKEAKLHVFSRTRNAPYLFYYRYLALDEMNWYPWEKVQVDIPSYDVEDSNGLITGNGCYLTPVVWNGRLLIFFPQFMKKTKPNPASTGKIADLAKEDQSKLKPYEYWEIKMAWSEYRDKKWTQKQLSSSVVTIDLDINAPNRKISDFLFFTKKSANNLTIAIDDGVNDDGIATVSFVFDGSILKKDNSDISKKIPLKTPLGVSIINPMYYFQNLTSGSTVGFTLIQSYQIINSPSLSQNLDWEFFRNFAVYKNPERIKIRPDDPIIRFYLPHLDGSIKKINAPKLEELFYFNLQIGTTHGNAQIDQSYINDSFGGYNTNNTSVIYHELKRPYSLYNWELFFHTPIMIADALSKAQQFEESMQWFHYVFNPIAEGIDDKRFWQFRPFKEINSYNVLEQLFGSLKGNEPNAAINEWRNHPFQPHLVARSRPVAYMKWVVMKYIDNILAWGDYLFRQDTIESINQATQLYVLAGHILGRRPMKIPKPGEVKTQTYHSLLDKWDAFSNAMTELEVSVIYNIQPAQQSGSNISSTATVDYFGTASSLYFCVPNNPKLLGYWDTLADRLFKIRHCQNIEGVFRKLPLFEPPIDPALLVKAAAQGLSISSVINDLNTPMPNYRFYYLLQKALELCNELKSLGGAMLSAIEKRDNETISLIRAKHEGTMNNLVMEIKKLQLEEAQKSLESLQQNRKAPEARMKYYLQLIGEQDSIMPDFATEFTGLANNIEAPIDESGLKLSKYEKEDMDKSSEARLLQLEAGQKELLASILHLIPSVSTDLKPFGIGLGGVFGGPMLGGAIQAWAKGLQNESNGKTYLAANAAKKGGFQRALQDRIFQANAAGYELKQIDKQITAQLIRINMANQEISNQQKQIDNVQEVEEFLKNKYTNEELYTWMRGSLKTLYRQVYNLAYDLAKKAERTYCFERGISQANFIQSGYFDAGREGLLAGEQLYVGLKQLEAAYHEKRGYDYELTKHVSLRQLDPLALLHFKVTGSSEFEIPEALFDMDYPGHYKRRIKSISVSIPCVAGPYTGVNATMQLLHNRFRMSSVAANAASYVERTNEQDDRFYSYNIPITSIATSSGQNDAGMFELNFKDERYLPFEGAGVISRWRLELPSVKQFDYNTISDVVLHVKYTASNGGDQLKKWATDSVQIQLNQINQELNETGLHVPINLKHDMPTEWHLLKKNGKIDLTIGDSVLPYFVQSFQTRTIENVMFIAKVKDNPLSFGIKINEGSTTDLMQIRELELCTNVVSGIQLNTSFKLSVPQNTNDELLKLDELIMVVKYRVWVL